MRYKEEYEVVVSKDIITDNSGSIGVTGNHQHAIYEALKVLPPSLQEKFVKVYNKEYQIYFRREMEIEAKECYDH
jgi:hypothetical protein